MATISHEPPAAMQRPWWLEARDVWASLAIATIWLAVLLTAVLGPDVETTSAAPGSSTSVPSVLGVAFFAALATWAVAKYGFDRRPRER